MIVRQFGYVLSFFLLGICGIRGGLDTDKNDCHACDLLNDKECLSLLDQTLDALSDKNRLSFLRAVFTGAFMTASHLQQTEADAIQTCANLSDKQCLTTLDDQMDRLSDKTRLSYLVASCNMLQHWSAFSITDAIENVDEFQPLQTLHLVAAVLGVTAITVALAASVVFVKRRRYQRTQYQRLTAEFDFDFELET
uniref:Uncharacterized protein n=1 Tax=Aureoumbra lagunensis TaxID=44058 RepID=A0A7S3JS93_9STRA|mmetsp:Transcript_1050/g.1309  ORF Transcript_1050/g.1309 Transcript_1050/m.1309 type:complete len:195 (+) Transcript_1050:41-625(+)